MSYSMSPGPRRTYSNGQVVVVVIVVLLVIVGSGLLLYSTINYQIAMTGARMATAQASRAAFDAASTAIIASDDATATAQAGLTSTAGANTTATADARASAIAAARATSAAQANATSTAQANATSTAQAYANRDPYPPNTGKLVLKDPLIDNSQGHGWAMYTHPSNNNCQFVGGAYESSNENISGYGYNACFAANTGFSNFTYQVQIMLVQGRCGGIAFRGNINANALYYLEICSDGSYRFRQCTNGFCNFDFAAGTSPAINAGSGQVNTLAVVANGNVLTAYINGMQIAPATSSAYSSGQIGLVTSGEAGTVSVAMFRNAEVWTM